MGSWFSRGLEGDKRRLVHYSKDSEGKICCKYQLGRCFQEKVQAWGGGGGIGNVHNKIKNLSLKFGNSEVSVVACGNHCRKSIISQASSITSPGRQTRNNLQIYH